MFRFGFSISPSSLCGGQQNAGVVTHESKRQLRGKRDGLRDIPAKLRTPLTGRDGAFYGLLSWSLP